MPVGRTRALVALAVLAVTAAACSSAGPGAGVPTTRAGSGTASAPGVTSTTVTVGQVDDISLPEPGLFKGAEDGVKAYFDYVNSLGGVNGRKLVLDAQDSQFNGGIVTSATGAQIQKDFALVGGFSLLDSAEQPLIDLAHMPDIAYPLSPQLQNDPNVYSPGANSSGISSIGFMKYLAKTYPVAVKHVGILWANATASTQAAEQTFENDMRAEGFTIAYDRGFSPFESSFLSDVVKMKSAGVKLFFSDQMPDNYAATLAQEMQQEDFHPMVIQGAAYSNQLVKLGGAAVNGMYIEQQYALYLGQDAAAVPAVALFDKWVKKADSNANFEIETVYGWASAELFVDALRNAGPDPTRASLVAALNQITDFDAGGLIPPDNPAAGIPPQCWLLAQIKDGTVQRVSPSPSTGFVCSPEGWVKSPGWAPVSR